MQNIITDTDTDDRWKLRTNLDLVKEDLELCGPTYTVQVFLLNALWYGLPQDRFRIWLVGISNKIKNMAVQPAEVLQSVEKVLKLVQLEPPPAASSLR
jgi:site-specific DNA-cytosine methylase